MPLAHAGVRHCEGPRSGDEAIHGMTQQASGPGATELLIILTS